MLDNKSRVIPINSPPPQQTYSKPEQLTQYRKPLVATPEESYTLPSYLYTDPAVYEIEKEKIFYRTWQYLSLIHI